MASFALNDSSTSVSFNNEVFSKDSGHDKNQGFHYTFESAEQEVSKDSDVKDNDGFKTPFTPSKTLFYLKKLQARILINQYSQINLDNCNRAAVSLVVLHHSWKGFII